MKKKIRIFYDGDCPFCKNYIRFYRLKKNFAEMELCNARLKNYSMIIKDFINKGYDVNKGMIVEIDNQIYWGDEAIHILAMISSRSNLFNLINSFIFRSKLLSKIIYPMLVFGRSVTLKILGIKNIEL